MHRKLIRPKLGSKPAGPGGGARRALVPESTHAEAGYLVHCMESGSILVIELLGGGEMRAQLLGHDRDALILAGPGGTPVIVRKERIRAYWIEAPLPAQSVPR